MKKHGFIFLILLSFVSLGQNVDSIINAVELKIDSNELDLSYLPDSLQQYACEGLIYCDSNQIYKLEKGCGDASIEMSRQHYYFSNGELTCVISKRYYFNAPPNSTKEVAIKEGVTSGWFDSTKTMVTQYQCFFKQDKMIKFIDTNESEIPSDDDSFKKTETVMVQEITDAKNYFNLIYKK